MSFILLLLFFFFPLAFTFYFFFEFILSRPGVQDGLTLLFSLLIQPAKKVFNGLGLIFAPITAATLRTPFFFPLLCIITLHVAFLSLLFLFPHFTSLSYFFTSPYFYFRLVKPEPVEYFPGDAFFEHFCLLLLRQGYHCALSSVPSPDRDEGRGG